MTCSHDDLKACALGELDRQARAICESHIAECASCREEWERLRLTQASLLAVPEEAMPHRIAFVSDRVFEPKWWQVWASGPAAAIACAVLVAGAILAHGYARPVPQGVVTAQVVDTVQMEQRVEQEVTRRMQATLAKTVADLEKREDAKHQTLLVTAQRKLQEQGQELAAAQQSNRLYQQQMGRMMVAYNRGGQ